MVPEFGVDSLREIIFGNYRVVYSLTDDDVYVLTVIHASTDILTRLRELGISDA